MGDTLVMRHDVGQTEPLPTVLVVDDDTALRTLLYRFLNENGYNVLTAVSGVDALVLCRQFWHRIDLLVTDVEMPGMSGFELAEHVHELRPEIRILVMTGGASSSPQGWCSALTVVSKPFNTSALISTIRQELQVLSNDA